MNTAFSSTRSAARRPCPALAGSGSGSAPAACRGSWPAPCNRLGLVDGCLLAAAPTSSVPPSAIMILCSTRLPLPSALSRTSPPSRWPAGARDAAALGGFHRSGAWRAAWPRTERGDCRIGGGIANRRTYRLNLRDFGSEVIHLLLHPDADTESWMGWKEIYLCNSTFLRPLFNLSILCSVWLEKS